MKALALALLTGLLFAFSLPPFDQEWLGWFAFVPLLLAAQGRRPLEAFGLGMIAGAASGVVQAGWHHDMARLFWAYIPFLWLAFLFGGVALASAKVPAAWNPTLRVLFLACVGISAEWLTSFLPLPLNIALCQYRQTGLLQIAGVTGIWGVSFLLWWVNAALAETVRFPSGSPMIEGRGAIWKPSLIGLTLVLASVRYGSLAQSNHRPGSTLRVAAIQDLTPVDMGDLIGDDAETDRAQMTRQAVARGAELAVWSEEALGSAFNPDDPKDETRRLARQTGTALVVGYSDRTWPKPYNCAAYVAPNGSVLRPVHHKIHLYLAERQTNLAGDAPTVVATPQGRIGLEICFDSCYTNTTRQEVAAGARLIAMPNYDPPTPRGVLHHLHGAMLPFRAVENGVPFIRADSNGLSQIVSADGRVIAQSFLFVPDVLVGNVVLGNGRGTFFTRFGDWLAYVCLLIAGAGVAVSIRDLRRGTLKPCPPRASHPN